jgi:hypothetical protein
MDTLCHVFCQCGVQPGRFLVVAVSMKELEVHQPIVAS